MADFSKFRTAVSGFNRTDVVNYIESASMEHQKALRKLTDERDKLAAENAQLQTQLTGLQARLIQVQADNDALKPRPSRSPRRKPDPSRKNRPPRPRSPPRRSPRSPKRS